MHIKNRVMETQIGDSDCQALKRTRNIVSEYLLSNIPFDLHARRKSRSLESLLKNTIENVMVLMGIVLVLMENIMVSTGM